MIKDILLNSQYLQLIKEEYPKLSSSDQKRFDQYYKEYKADRLFLIDDSYFNKKLAQKYSSKGAPAKHQKQIFNSLFLYNNSNYLSLTKWVKALANDPVLKLLAGLSPDEKAPSLGSHYNLMKRLALDPEELNHIHPAGKNPHPLKPKDSGKAQNPVGGKKTQELAEDIRNGIDNSCSSQYFLRDLFYNLAVKKSLGLGLIPQEALDVSGDGTCLPVKTNCLGRIRKNLNKDQRWYASPLAAFGWDSSKKCYYEGFSPYFLNYYNPRLKKDLLLDWNLFPACEHDSTAFLKLISSSLDLLEEIEFNSFILDSAHDNQSTYQLLFDYGIHAIIDLNTRRNKPEESRNHSFSKDGVPICKENLEMKFKGSDASRGDLKWICPKLEKNTCICPKPCTNAKVPCYYTRPSKNLRYFTQIPRNSKRFKVLYSRRTGSERMNKQILTDHLLEQRGARSMYVNHFMIFLSGLDNHFAAQSEIITTLKTVA